MPFRHGVHRIACLQPSATVILDSLGELDRIVACTRYCADVVRGISDSPRVILADSWTADSTEIMRAKPDLVIAAVPYQEKAVVEILKAGVRFLGLAPKNLADIYTDIVTIAGLVNAAEKGQRVIDEMQERINSVRAGVSRAHRPRVFCEEWGKPVIASQVWVKELVEAAGGEFVGEPGRALPPAQVSALDADVVVAAWCGAGDRVPLEKIVADRGWSQTAASQAGRVYCIRDEFLNTPAPTLLRGLDALAHAIHPELFPAPDGIRQITTAPASALGDIAD